MDACKKFPGTAVRNQSEYAQGQEFPPEYTNNNHKWWTVIPGERPSDLPSDNSLIDVYTNNGRLITGIRVSEVIWDKDKVKSWRRNTLEPGDTKNHAVDHPDYYGGKDNVYEAIKVIEAWNLGFCLGNTVKYISRASKKNKDTEIEDLEKASWYLTRRIQELKDRVPAITKKENGA